MKPDRMTPAERVGTALSHKEADRVPYVLNAPMHAARRLGMGLKEGLTRPESVLAVQKHLREWLGTDVLAVAAPAACMLEPWGGGAEFHDDGPPTSGEPPLRKDALSTVTAPRWDSSAMLRGGVEAMRRVVQAMEGKVLVGGVVVSPFSLPVMQLGFENYLDVLLDHPADLDRLLRANHAFCLEYARAQVAAGASLVVCYDPVSSPTCVPVELARKVGLASTRAFVAEVGAPVLLHFASGRTLPVLDDVVALGAAAVGVSALDDLAAVKATCRGRITFMGQLNALEMEGWTPEEARGAVKSLLATAGPGGGFILAENHGEIPLPVPDTIVEALAQAAREHGQYPLEVRTE